MKLRIKNFKLFIITAYIGLTLLGAAECLVMPLAWSCSELFGSARFIQLVVLQRDVKRGMQGRHLVGVVVRAGGASPRQGVQVSGIINSLAGANRALALGSRRNFTKWDGSFDWFRGFAFGQVTRTCLFCALYGCGSFGGLMLLMRAGLRPPGLVTTQQCADSWQFWWPQMGRALPLGFFVLMGTAVVCFGPPLLFGADGIPWSLFFGAPIALAAAGALCVGVCKTILISARVGSAQSG